jgi:hypothetical protein
MTKRGRLRPFATALLIATSPMTALAQSSPESASVEKSPSAVQIETQGCATLRSNRIEQLLRLELATLVPVVSELPTLEIQFVCTGDDVRIALKDPVTVKIVTRDVSVGASADPERALALAASELFLASWAELLIPRPEDKTRASNPGVAAAKRAVERVVPAPKSLPPTVAVDLRVIGRERNFSAPVSTLGGALQVGLASCQKPQLFAEAAWEAGSVERPGGRVDINTGALGTGARLCLPVGVGELGLFGSVRALYISFQGVPSSPAYSGSHFDGFTAEAAVGIDANVTLDALRVGAALLVGATAPGPGASVRGGAPVRLEGPWAGASLFAGLLL